MANQKFYEAARRGKLPYPTSRADVGKGWPLVLYPWFLACAQLPDGDTIARDAFTLHMGDSIRAGALPAVRQRIPWFIENEVIEPHVTAQDFAAWLASEGVTPSPLVAEWFKHQDVASSAPAPAQHAATPAPVVADSADDGEAWKAKARERADEIIKRQRAKDLHPSQEDIADEIAREFRADGVMGAGGKPLTGAYIKRHALKGISSAQNRQLSTSIRRGK